MIEHFFSTEKSKENAAAANVQSSGANFGNISY